MGRQRWNSTEKRSRRNIFQFSFFNFQSRIWARGKTFGDTHQFRSETNIWDRHPARNLGTEQGIWGQAPKKTLPMQARPPKKWCVPDCRVSPTAPPTASLMLTDSVNFRFSGGESDDSTSERKRGQLVQGSFRCRRWVRRRSEAEVLAMPSQKRSRKGGPGGRGPPSPFFLLWPNPEK
jgi:hypothetical protein